MNNDQEELKEKNFIHEGYAKNPVPPWFWLAVIAAVVALVWGSTSWYRGYQEEKMAAGPFTQVTNRDFSLFLWQNPEYMRVNVSTKMGYLEGFQYLQKVTVEPEMADKLVVAPPKVVFLYHVWDRLLGDEFIPRKIGSSEFVDFLAYCEEWKPQFWPNAPKEYIEFVNSLPDNKVENLAALPLTTLPLEVRKAFIGWKNYLLEMEAINLNKPTYEEMLAFLKVYPNYARNFWRNIQGGEDSEYLLSLFKGDFGPEATVPEKELSGFLRVACFNYKQSQKKL